MGRHYEDGMRHLVAALSIAFLGAVVAEAAERPNVVWIMSEDNSMNYLKLYDEHGAFTPNIEALAAWPGLQSCLLQRAGLFGGPHHPDHGLLWSAHRYSSTHRRSELAAMPEGLKMFPPTSGKRAIIR
ncbi:MAG: hypothetical protein R3F31_15580 [Verrucomicrobiales bacterium]